MGSSSKDPTTPPGGAVVIPKAWGEISPRLVKTCQGSALSVTSTSTLEKKVLKPATTLPAQSHSDKPTSSACVMKALPNSNIPANAAERLLDQRGRCLPFLEKTYRMIDSSPTDLASWSDKGDSFIVFKPKEFSEDVIPLYFKHKNFSSFVRQLNFYGFRKTKANGKGNKKNTKNPDGTDKEWWEFRHERFLRGNKALMKTIKRKTNMQDGTLGGHPHQLTANAATLGEVKSLRSDIVVLSTRFKETSERLQAVTKIVLNVLKNGHLTKAEEEEAKKFLQDQSFAKSLEEDTELHSWGSEFSDVDDFDDEFEAYSTEESAQPTNKRKSSCLSMEEKPAKAKFLKPFIDTKASSGGTESLISPRALKFDFGASEFTLPSDINLCDDLDMDKLFDSGTPSNKAKAAQQWNGMSDGGSNGPFLNIMDDLPDGFFDSWQQTLPSPRHTAAFNQPTVA